MYIPSEWVLGSDCNDNNPLETIDCGGPGNCVYDWDCAPDTITCTYTTCDAGQCVHHENDTACHDESYCNGWGEQCSIAFGGCTAADSFLQCEDDLIDCTIDCIEYSDHAACEYVEDDDLCLPGEVCDVDFGGCAAEGNCGDGIIGPGEECDFLGGGLLNLSGQSCSSQDYPAGGDLGCYPASHQTLNCTFNYSGCSLLPKYTKFNGTTTNFSYPLIDIGNVPDSLLEINVSGMINYSGSVLNYTRLNLDEYVTIEPNRIGVDITGHMNRMRELNNSGVLEFYGVSFNNPMVLRNEMLCPETLCNITNYTKGEFLRLEVIGFSIYRIIETPFCGDGACNGGESCSSCPGDCGDCDDEDDSSSSNNNNDSPGTTYQCSDLIDNDLDGFIDYPNDPSCDSQFDNDESPVDQLVGPGDCDE
ncbi:MAG: hypothetical protein ABH864_00030 [archaeon]